MKAHYLTPLPEQPGGTKKGLLVPLILGLIAVIGVVGLGAFLLLQPHAAGNGVPPGGAPPALPADSGSAAPRPDVLPFLGQVEQSPQEPRNVQGPPDAPASPQLAATGPQQVIKPAAFLARYRTIIVAIVAILVISASVASFFAFRANNSSEYDRFLGLYNSRKTVWEEGWHRGTDGEVLLSCAKRVWTVTAIGTAFGAAGVSLFAYLAYKVCNFLVNKSPLDPIKTGLALIIGLIAITVMVFSMFYVKISVNYVALLSLVSGITLVLIARAIFSVATGGDTRVADCMIAIALVFATCLSVYVSRVLLGNLLFMVDYAKFIATGAIEHK